MTRRSQFREEQNYQTEKLDPHSGVVEDLASAVDFPCPFQSHTLLHQILEEGESEHGEGALKPQEEDEGAQHIEEIVYLDLDDGASTLVGHDHEVGEKEIEMEVDDSSSEPEGANGECGMKRKRTIRVIIRSRAFI